MKWLAVDPGDAHLGLAVCDEAGIVARPLATLRHVARAEDARRIVVAAVEQGAGGIVIGIALTAEGEVGPQGRKAERLAAALREQTDLPVVLHDEWGSSRLARESMSMNGRTRRSQRTREHAAAAAAILQSYLDAHPREATTSK
jgi:putative Holliday junction resolvase